MDRSQLTELHYITAGDNVASIFEHGVLSHNRANKVSHRSVAMQEIQDIRAGKSIPGGRDLHDYANFYVNGRNVMMSKVLYGASIDDICLLRVSTDILDLPGVVMSDQNAASKYARFAPPKDVLARIDKDYVFARSWKHPDDQIQEWRHTSAMCAEVLVPDKVDAQYILGAYVGTEAGRRAVLTAAQGLAVVIDADKFLR